MGFMWENISITQKVCIMDPAEDSSLFVMLQFDVQVKCKFLLILEINDACSLIISSMEMEIYISTIIENFWFKIFAVLF